MNGFYQFIVRDTALYVGEITIPMKNIFTTLQGDLAARILFVRKSILAGRSNDIGNQDSRDTYRGIDLTRCGKDVDLPSGAIVTVSDLIDVPCGRITIGRKKGIDVASRNTFRICLS